MTHAVRTDVRLRELRRLMERHGLSAQAVANRLQDIGVRRQLVYRWLTPSLQRPIPVETLRLLEARLMADRHDGYIHHQDQDDHGQ